jgi:hypothetical protein
MNDGTNSQLNYRKILLLLANQITDFFCRLVWSFFYNYLYINMKNDTYTTQLSNMIGEQTKYTNFKDLLVVVVVS